MENDNSLPTWLSLTNSYVDTDDDGVKDQFSTTIKISKENINYDELIDNTTYGFKNAFEKIVCNISWST